MNRKLICVLGFICLAGAAAPAWAGPEEDPNLVGWWKLDDGSGPVAADSSGNARDATIVGEPNWVEGVDGGALLFDADMEYLTIPGFPGVLGTSSRTCTAWINTDKNAAAIMVWGQMDMGTKWTIRINEGGELRNEVDAGYQYGTTNLLDDEWHHVAVVLEDDGSPNVEESRLYVDGLRENTGAVAEEPINTLSDVDVHIANDPMTGGREFVGLMDDVRIYDRALSETEIKKLAARVKAHEPSPADGATHEDTWVNLSWSSGVHAVSHDVYFDENFDDVNDGTGDTFRDNQTMAYFVAGFPGYPYPDGLVPGTTYYWQIDEVNGLHLDSPWKVMFGALLFPPKKASDPIPADGAESLDMNVRLSWTAGFGAILHTVYFGKNFDDVNDATGGVPIGVTTYSPGTLELGKTYYWRVDAFDTIATYKGDVWSFTTEGAVGNPNPPNGAVDVKQTPILRWSPAVYAASHQVYFGSDQEAVRNANTDSPEYKGTKALGDERCDPGKLARDTTYYWRVDEVNSVHADSPWKCPV